MKKTPFILSLALAALAAPPPAKTDRAVLRVPYWMEGPAAPVVTAKLNGETVKVARLLGPHDDLVLLVVLDLAGDLSRVDPARDALNEQLGNLPPNAVVSLLRAQDGLRVLLDPTADRAAARTKIQELTISGRAGLLDTVETALALGDAMLEKAKVRVALLYISDSLVTNYREDFANPVVNSSDSGDMSRRFPEAIVKVRMQQLLAKLGRTQTPLFVVQLNYENDRLNEAYQTGLLELANSTGGSAEFARTLSEIPVAIARTVERVLAHSSAELEFKRAKAKQWEVELTTEGTGIRHRTRFLAGVESK